ncbi:MAG: B12-binding domain-containing protein [Desulfohalobiaceae bacterium]
MHSPEDLCPQQEDSSHLRGIQDRFLADLARQYLHHLLQGERQRPSELILNAVQEGRASVQDIYLQVFQPVLYEVGRLWETNQVSVAVEHFCTAATQLVMSQLFPYILSTEKNGCSMVACCVGNELHEVGMRMVSDFFEMQGWETYFLGANCPSQDVLQALEQKNAHILAISVTMQSHLPRAQELIKLVSNQTSLQRLKILIGGYPFVQNPDLARDLGAHGCGRDAAQALQLAQKLVNCGE